MSNQAKCGVPAVKQPTVKEPEDSSTPPVMRGPEGLDEGRRGGTGERRRGKARDAGSEVDRVRSEKEGPDLPTPADVRDPKSKGAGRGETRRRSGDGGKRSRERSGDCSKSVPDLLRFLDVRQPEDPHLKDVRGPEGVGEGRTCYSRKFSSKFSNTQKLGKILSEEERVEKALLLVSNINQYSRQKKGGLMDLSVSPASVCPLCVLGNVCLKPSCLGKRRKY